MTTSPGPPASGPQDLAGSRFLGSVGSALAAAVWGSVCGALVEAAVDSGPAARLGALLGALLLTACSAALAFAEGHRQGLTEGLGRALHEALSSSWRGLWLGGLVGGAFAAGGGVGLLLLLLAATAGGGLLGLFLARLRQVNGLVQRLNLALSLGLLGGFLVAAWWGTPGTSVLSPTAAAIGASPVFGPSATWIWMVGAGVPLVVAGGVWWIRSGRPGPAPENDPDSGPVWRLAALIFVGALAAGLGAVAGAAGQWLAGQLLLGGLLTPTPGKWLGAALALIFWGTQRQPAGPALHVMLRERLTALVSSLVPEGKPGASAAAPAPTEMR